jgi:hypothetical protein
LSATGPKQQSDYDELNFLGIPNPPSNAANGCLDPTFCGAVADEAAASSTFRMEAAEGSYGLRKKSSTGCAR